MSTAADLIDVTTTDHVALGLMRVAMRANFNDRSPGQSKPVMPVLHT
jgi:hypothetical protein